MSKRLLIFIYGLIAYAIGMGGLVWFILFLGSWDFLPQHINSQAPGHLPTALAINGGLMLLFAIQHSVTARPAFKKQLTKLIPPAAERSTYILLSGAIMAMFCLYWQPVEGELWRVEVQPWNTLLVSGYIAGWAIAVLATFQINHFELFGLQQVYYHVKKTAEPPARFTERLFYKVVRHPLQLGVLIGIWITPLMTITHLLLALGMTLYIFIGLHYEEKDLTAQLGARYTDYQNRVRMILPFPK
ncbi:methyltransferase family protein [Oceanicoccus sagamiensis]|uniref:NnrU domain-containing protein n=1 Tax=Oceanicoccus sagamiensis TaxID=716816 RepID=A0A1X9NL31_9GAMM|nr:NnrU family protein [Oceanicoccus sagamiensis]ARN74653.1 hypothetical protein BST96_11275 [Oceanicoccus sagamiensis]